MAYENLAILFISTLIEQEVHYHWTMLCTDVCKWVSYPIAGYLGPWSLSQNGKIWSFDLCTFHTHTHTWIQVRPSSYRTKWCRHRTSKYTMGDFPKHFIHLYTVCDLTKKQILRNRLYTFISRTAASSS